MRNEQQTPSVRPLKLFATLPAGSVVRHMNRDGYEAIIERYHVLMTIVGMVMAYIYA